jgi:hypothetical protein
VEAQYGKTKSKSAVRNILAACCVAGCDEVMSNLGRRGALRYSESHAPGQVCVFEQRQAIPVRVGKQAGKVDLSTLEHVDDCRS